MINVTTEIIPYYLATRKPSPTPVLEGEPAKRRAPTPANAPLVQFPLRKNALVIVEPELLYNCPIPLELFQVDANEFSVAG